MQPNSPDKRIQSCNDTNYEPEKKYAKIYPPKTIRATLFEKIDHQTKRSFTNCSDNNSVLNPNSTNVSSIPGNSGNNIPVGEDEVKDLCYN